uniref:Putative cytochrome n=1 Tax=Nyssomyia neivai TaxID=330878 RepID=A0A1L8E432_9DIPT
MSLESESMAESRLGFFSPLMLPLIATTISLTVVYIWMQSQRITKMGHALPGPPTLPFVGNAHILMGKTHSEIFEFVLELSNGFGNVIRAFLGNSLVVFLTHPADIEIILNSQVHLDKSDEYRFFKPWLGDGLLISSGDRWRSHRKIIAPAFHMNVLKSFVNTFNSNSLAVVDKMREEVGKEFDVHDYMSAVTVDILLETAMGTERTRKGNEGFNYAMAVMKMCDILHARHMKFYLRFDTIFNWSKFKREQEKLLSIIHGLTKKVIKKKTLIFDENMKKGIMPSPSLNEIISQDTYSQPDVKKAPKGETKGLRDDLDEIDENDIGEKRRLAFLDLMIESARGGTANLSDDDIKQQVDTIMFEGHDTTAAGSSFVLCLMGTHQDIQERVYKELKQIFGDSDRLCTFADTLEMKYLERVIMESLRLYPPVPLIARKIQQDVKLNTDNYVLPAGCTVVIGTFKLHRRGDIYPNPEVFNPDNFLPEHTQNRHYYSFIPFSAGPRSCVGRKYAMLKLKVLLSTILRNYKINSTVNEKDYKLQADIILKRADGFRLSLEPRRKVKV